MCQHISEDGQKIIYKHLNIILSNRYFQAKSKEDIVWSKLYIEFRLIIFVHKLITSKNEINDTGLLEMSKKISQIFDPPLQLEFNPMMDERGFHNEFFVKIINTVPPNALKIFSFFLLSTFT